jgi:hypothetical protein
MTASMAFAGVVDCSPAAKLELLGFYYSSVYGYGTGD